MSITTPLRCILAAGLVLSWAAGAWADVTLTVTPIDGTSSVDVDFGTVRSLGREGRPEGDVVFRQVRLTITSTGSQRYQVMQTVNAPWRNLGGDIFPIEAVESYVSDTQTDGIIRIPNPAPLKIGEREIFVSNANGDSEEFLITYTTKVPVGQLAGRYRTTVTYRVVQR